jgi:hypothetical protein
MLNIDVLFHGPISSLANIPRFSLYARSRDESVAEHSYYVTLYSLIIAEELNAECKRAEERVDTGDVLKTALLHDLGECMIGDINGVFKTEHAHAEWRFQLKQYEAVIRESVMRQASLPLTVLPSGNPRCGIIVKIADLMSVLGFISRERLSGNMLFLKQVDLDSLKRMLESVRSDAYNIFAEEPALKIMQHIFSCLFNGLSSLSFSAKS